MPFVRLNELDLATTQGTNMKSEIRQATTRLKGKALWRASRTLDMAKFDFGDRRTRSDSDGAVGEVGEFALHIQCPWRIAREDKVIVGNGDLYYPTNYQYNEDVPDEFDWERTPTLLDRLLDVVFEDGKRQFIVQRVEVGDAGSLHIVLSERLSLDVLPCDSLQREHWRLFEPDNLESHFVVTGQGIKGVVNRSARHQSSAKED
jgi:hypothetical protein